MQLVTPGGAPLTSSAGRGGTGAAGPEVELTQQNVQQVLANPGAVLVQVGKLEEAASKKIVKLREASGGRLPLAHLNCQTLPQICQALQIQASPCLLLIAKGQVVAAVENDMSASAITTFVEGVAKMIGVKVDLGEGVNEQLSSAEELERKDPEAAEKEFTAIGQGPDLPHAAKVRVAAGRVRCAIRLPGRLAEARGGLESIEKGGFGGVPEVKQALALLRLADASEDAPAPMEVLKAAFEADPNDNEALRKYITALFWIQDEEEAVDAGLKAVRRNRSDECRKLVLAVIEALGPRHPRQAKARKSFNGAMFV